MEEVQIEVKYVNPPKQPGWSGNIKGSDGEYYGVPEECLGNFRVGEVVNLGFDHRQAKNGKWYRDAKLKNGQPLQTGLPSVTAPPQPPPQQGRPASQPMTLGQPKQDTPPILSNVLATAITAGLIQDANDMAGWAKAVRMAVDVYQNPMASVPAGSSSSGMTDAQYADDPDDGIPPF